MVNLLDSVKGFVSNPINAGIAGGIAGVAVGAGATAAISGIRKRRKSGKAKRSRKRKGKSKRNKRKYYPEPKGKKHSRRKIRTTKSGQPYIILASGKARFIKKSSARASRKRKGGRY